MSSDERAGYIAERALDQILADSFPASDPPPWTLGVASRELPEPALSAPGRGVTAGAGGDVEPVRREGPEMSPPIETRRPILPGLVSLVGAADIAVLVPVVILLVGLPVVLMVRGVADAIGWLLAWIVVG